LRVLFLLLLALAPFASGAVEDELIKTLGQVESLRGDFLQQQYNTDDEIIGESSGHFSLKKGGFFSWEITEPDSQLIVATPEFLWHLDRDLETVTRRPVNNSAEMSPLQVLGGDTAYLRDNYAISPAGEGGFTLTPTQIDPGFQSLTLRFKGGQIVAMSIRDNLAQRVEVEFSALDSTALTVQDFDFQPPPGADLFYYDQ
jgi:outer membrane lipoprotein carrier protein